MANAHSRKNFIGKIKVNGVMMENEEDISSGIVNFYSSLFHEEVSRRPTLDGIQFSTFDEGEADWLERRWDEDEVFEVVCSLNGDKAPGPDGFTLAFFHKCWSMVKGDLLKMLDQFYDDGFFKSKL